MNAFRTLCACLCLCLTGTALYGAIEASVEVYQFRTPEQPYAEVSVYILGSSVRFTPRDSIFYQAGVEVVLFIAKDGIIHIGDKYNLISPLSRRALDFTRARRYPLNAGKYTLQIEFRDLADSTNYLGIEKSFQIRPLNAGLAQSDIQLCIDIHRAETSGTHVKNGYALEPIPFHHYHEGLHDLFFYHEIYNADQAFNEDFLLTWKVIRPNAAKPDLTAHKRLEPKAIIPVVVDVPLDDLKSGTYALHVEVRAKDRTLLSADSTTFTLDNPYADKQVRLEWSDTFVGELSEEDLIYALRALTPITPQDEVEVLNYLVAKGEPRSRKIFLYRFWHEKNPRNPEEEYHAYMEVANAVHERYQSGFGYGFETDRGHMFLKYGAPDDVVSVEDEPSAPPYEIWIYYSFPKTNQSNVKFLFYNPSLATNDYILLHSTANGERQNPRWEVELYRDAPNEIEGNNIIDATQMQDNFHRNARRYFNDF